MDNGLAAQCVLVCKVPNFISQENLYSIVKNKISQQFTEEGIIATKKIPYLETDAEGSQNLWRCILRLSSQAAAEWLQKEHTQNVNSGTDIFTCKYQRVCEVPAEWIQENNKVNDRGPPPVITRCESRPTSDHLSLTRPEFASSGYYQNYPLPGQPGPGQMLPPYIGQSQIPAPYIVQGQMPPPYTGQGSIPYLEQNSNRFPISNPQFWPMPGQFTKIRGVSNAQYAGVSNQPNYPPDMPLYLTQSDQRIGVRFQHSPRFYDQMNPRMCDPRMRQFIPAPNFPGPSMEPLPPCQVPVNPRLQENHEEQKTEELIITSPNVSPPKIVVTNIPEKSLNAKIIQMVFKNKKWGEANVRNVDLFEDKAMAIVTFAEPEDVQKVLQKRPIKIGNTEVYVEMYVPEQTVTDAKKILVSNLPSTCNNEEYVRMYFEQKNLGGWSVVNVEMLEDGMAIVEFQESEAVIKILEQCPLVMKKTTVDVKIYAPEPTVLDTIEVRGPSDIICEKYLEFLQLYFENERKSDGDTVAKIDIDKEASVVYVTFETEEVATRVVERGSHMLNKMSLEVQLHIPERTSSKETANNRTTSTSQTTPPSQSTEKPEDESLPPLCTVKVKGFSKLQSRSTLQYYFENYRRSGGGGDVKIESDDEDQDVLIVRFEKEEIAREVVSRQHTVEKCDLMVSLYVPPKPKPCYRDRVLIKGIKPTTSKDGLFNYLEAKTGCIPNNLSYHAEDENVVMVTFETLDFQKLEECTKKFKLENATLEVSQIPISNCILVSHLTSDITNDTLKYYFENTQTSGGGSVEKVDRLMDDDGSCFVYFNDYQVINGVLNREHILCEQKLDVHLYQECLAQPEGEDSERRLKIPDPVIISTLEPDKIKFLMQTEMQRKAVQNHLANCFANVSWPTNEKENISISCTLKKGVKDCFKLAKDWIKTVEDIFYAQMKDIVVCENSVLQDIWTKVMEKLKSINIQNPEAAALFADKNQGVVTIVGMRNIIDEVSQQITSAIKQISDEAEREKLKIKETVTILKPIETEMLLLYKFPDKIGKEFTDLKVNINKNKNEIVFEGVYSDVNGAKLRMYELKMQFAWRQIDSLSKFTVDLYTTKSTKDHIVKKLKLGNIISAWEVNNQSMLIYSINEDRLQNCVDIIRESVVEHKILLDSSELCTMNSDQWKNSIKQWHNSHLGKCHIEFEDSSKILHVCCTDDIAQKLFKQVQSFLHENTIYVENMSFEKNFHRLIERCHKQKISDIEKDCSQFNLHIGYGQKDNSFEIRGTKNGIQLAKEKLKALNSRIGKKKHTIEKPGLGIFMQSTKGKDIVNTIESTNDCVIEIKGWQQQNNEEENLNETVSADKHTGTKIQASCKFYDVRSIFIVEGDMTELSVNVLVNSADEKLSLQGGLGKVLAMKGGTSIQKDCEDYIRKNGHMNPGETFVCNGGNLKANYIVHIMGPVWQGGTNNEDDLLTEAVLKSMKQASLKKAKSVAIPAISCGVFSFPVKRATNIIVTAIKNFFREDQESSVTEVYLCDVKGNIVNDFTGALQKEFGEHIVTVYKSEAAEKKKEFSKPQPAPRSGNDKNEVKIGNIVVTFVIGEIAKQKVDVIENTTAKNLDLNNGAVSLSLLKAAGKQLQDEVTAKYPNGLSDDQVAVTSGHNLQCRMVVHGSLPNWKEGDATSIQALKKLMFSCLNEAQKKNYASVAFPAMGTGNLGFPKHVVAKEMFYVISKFNKDNPSSSVKDIRFVVYHLDKDTIQAFKEETCRWSSGERSTGQGHFDNKTEHSHGKQQHKHQDSIDSHQRKDIYKAGKLEIVVKIGDITDDDADCIVNSSNEHLDLSRGAVSKAILEKGGNALKQEVEKKKKRMKSNKLVSTKASSNFNCKLIIHVVAQDDCNSWKDIVNRCLHKAEKKRMSSIAFPALGTAGSSIKPHEIAKTMVEAIKDFEMTMKPAHLKEIRFVLFQTQMLPDFQSVLTSTCGSPQTGFYKRSENKDSQQQNFLIPDKVTFIIWSLDSNTLRQAIEKLDSNLNKESHHKNFDDSSIIRKLQDNQLMQIKTIAQNANVSLKINYSNATIEIDGFTENVILVSDQIHSIMRDVTSEESMQTSAELMTNIVQWFYMEATTTDKKLQPYEKKINYQIEQAFKNKENSFKFKVDNEDCTLDFSSMEVTFKNSMVSVIRRDLLKESSFEPPASWEPMNNNLKVVTLKSSDKEYQDVEASFKASSGGSVKVSKIERVQNKTLWQQYLAKKKQLESQNPTGTKNERLLWHGTAHATVDSITTHGFNRSYCGKNATAFGDGVYFAVSANYSCQDIYSPPDPKNVKRIYYCRVLTGEYTTGLSGMKVPPAKPAGGSHALFDSVTNDMKKSIMFIIFHDTQAYPEYLISFTT